MELDDDEVEDVQIGSTKLVLPSKICTNKKVFDKVFSLDTWNDVLDSEQKEKIMKLLPPEILAVPNLGLETIKELFNGELTRFGVNPLDQFFNELYHGGYFPEVSKFKALGKAEWNKEILYRTKAYHTQLFQELIVSTDKYLKKYLGSSQQSQIKSISKNSNNNHSKQQQQRDITTKCINKKSTAKPNPQPANGTKKDKKTGVKRSLEKDPSTSNLSSDVSKNVAEDHPPASKKPLQVVRPLSSPNNHLNSSKPSKKQNSKTSIKKTSPSKVCILDSSLTPIPNDIKPTIQESPIPPPPSLPPTLISTSTFNFTPSIPIPIPATSYNKQETLIPISTSGLSNFTATKLEPRQTLSQNFEIYNPPFSTAGSIIIPKSSPISVTGRSVITVSHPNVISKEISISNSSILSSTCTLIPTTSNTIKSSPILASQLQAPLISSITNPCRTLLSKPMISHLQETFKKAPESISLPQVINMSFSRNDDMTSSSDDEFEAIEPTIGFSAVLPMKLNQPTKSPNKSKPSIGLFTNKVLPPKPRAVYASKVTAHNKNNSIGKVTIANTNLMTGAGTSRSSITTISSSNTISNTNTSIPISSTAEPTSTVNLTSQSKPNVTTATANESPTSNIKPNIVLSSQPAPKIFPIANIKGGSGSSTDAKEFEEISSGKDIIKRTSIITAGNTNLTTSISNAQPNSEIKNFPKPTAIIISTRRPGPGSKIIPGETQIQIIEEPKHDILCKSPPSITHSTSILKTETPVPALSPIHLSLGEVGLDLGEEKLGQGMDDKIDDLSVLDGNPFDSIPNLSDELDGLDLDLDGLCDFESLLSEEKQYASFFSFIREVLCSTQFHRMTLVCLERTVRKWSISPSAAMNSWFMRIDDWNEALVTALNFLAGNYQGPNIHPEDFVPYIEYKYKTKYYQWIGAGRDGDNNLLPLCNTWLDNLDKLPPLKKQDGEIEEPEDEDDENEDSDEHAEEIKKKYLRPKTPPPPRFCTDWTVRASTEEERKDFQEQERSRFENPHKAFTYQMHKYESVVGPVKGVYSSQSGITNKARGHSLLVDDRPPYVTILALVRDSVARLPNGEGTRSEICEMLRDSAFLAPGASNLTLNSVVSGALDRLHYERDPCVRYDSHKKNWIYLHRDRSQEQFERLHHNRSYTKSTKSRSSNSRKARKKALSQSSSTTSTNSTPSTPSAIPASTPNLSLPNNLDKPGPITETVPGNSAFSPTNKNVPPNLPLKAITLPIPSGSIKDEPIELIPATLKIENSPLQSVDPAPINNNLSNEVKFSISPPPAYGTATTTSSPLHFPFANVHRVQTPTSRVFTFSGPAISTQTVQSPAQAQLSSMPSSQLLLGSNGVVRLSSNLKLPQGVRFAQIRLPLNQGGSNILRLPAQRILLRATLPGHGQTQGVLVGQTSTGQTIILSTAPHIPISTQASQQPIPHSYSVHQSDTHEYKFSPQQFNHNPIISSISTSAVSVPISTTAAPPTFPKTTVTVHTHPSFSRPTPSASESISSAGVAAKEDIKPIPTPIVSLSNPIPSQQRHQVGQQNAIQRYRQFESSHPGHLNTPIIIRSHQGEFVIPGHMMARGMHGVKVIPVPAGKQVVARFVSPGQGPTSTTKTMVTQDIKQIIAQSVQK